MNKTALPAILPDIDALIVTLRDRKVILDADLARVYGVPTSRFNEAVKRNDARFPLDFMFRLSRDEWAGVQSLRSQFAILETGRGRQEGGHQVNCRWQAGDAIRRQFEGAPL